MKLIKLLFVVIALLLVGNVVVANQAVDESVTVKAISADISALTAQNQSLRSQVAAAGSLSHIAERVTELGFVETPQIVSLVPTSTVALR